MKEFLLDNWKFLLEILLLIVSTIIVICKRKVKLKVDEDAIMTYLPEWINEAEVFIGSGNGDKKLEFVVKKALNYFSISYGCDIKDIPGTFIVAVIEMVESVLSTPTKKKEIVK